MLADLQAPHVDSIAEAYPDLYNLLKTDTLAISVTFNSPSAYDPKEWQNSTSAIICLVLRMLWSALVDPAKLNWQEMVEQSRQFIFGEYHHNH